MREDPLSLRRDFDFYQCWRISKLWSNRSSTWLAHAFDFAPRLPQWRGPDHRLRPYAGGTGRGGAVALSARAHRTARTARGLVRDRARASARRQALRARRAAG